MSFHLHRSRCSLSSLAIENPTTAPAPSHPARVVRVHRPAPAWTSPEAMLMGGLLALAFAGLFFRWFWTQGLLSAERMQDWGHAYFIPLIAGYLVWQKRAELSRIRPAVFWPGLAPMLLGIMSY